MLIRPANPSDLPSIRRLLADGGLPYRDLTPEHLVTFLVARDDRATPPRYLGTVGLEAFGRYGLLRSLAVCEAARDQRIGSQLVASLEALARERGVRHLYLLTTTAESYFRRRGWRAVPRDQVPGAVRGSSEFSSLCPETAACLELDLQASNAS